jgi:nicotinamide-nucleotide amidase
MNAEIIAIGSEMLTPGRVDTNSLWLTGEFNALGIEVVAKMVVGDHLGRMAELIRGAIGRSELVMITGGLGPTEDDLTREATAEALGRTLVESVEARAMLTERFKRFNRPMAANNLRQAFLIEGAEMLNNDRGSAPGQWVEVGGRYIALLPGPPHELKAMFAQQVLPRLVKIAPKLVIRSLEYRVAGIGESDLDSQIAPVYKGYDNPVTTVLAKPGDIQVILRAQCSTEEEAEALLAAVGPRIEAVLGDKVYSRGNQVEPAPTMEAVIGQLLQARGETIAVAESCTGGLLAEKITSVAGSSAYFVGGFLTYTEQMKVALLGVDAALIARHGVVSVEVAEAMARGAVTRTGATHALAITGVAGPGGATGTTPLGTVCLGYAGPKDTAKSRRFQHPGDRQRVRQVSAQYALDLLRRQLT